MKIAGLYSFNKGQEAVESGYHQLYGEVTSAISAIDASSCLTKVSKENTMRGELLYSPIELNKRFKTQFSKLGWNSVRVQCKYPTKFYLPDYKSKELHAGAFREMDFVKENLGVEVQFGKYSFMVYNVAAKMTIFRNLGHINTGIEIVPVKKLADNMSSGASYFEQFVWDLEARGTSNIDIPVLIIGIDA